VELALRRYRILEVTMCQRIIYYDVTYILAGQNDIKLINDKTNVAEQINKIL